MLSLRPCQSSKYYSTGSQQHADWHLYYQFNGTCEPPSSIRRAYDRAALLLRGRATQLNFAAEEYDTDPVMLVRGRLGWLRDGLGWVGCWVELGWLRFQIDGSL